MGLIENDWGWFMECLDSRTSKDRMLIFVCGWSQKQKNVSNFPPYLWRVAIDWTSVCYCTHSHWELMVRWSPRPAIVTMTCWRVVMCIYIYTYPPEPTTQFKKWAKIEKHTYCVMKRKGYLGIICYNTNIYIDSEYIYRTSSWIYTVEQRICQVCRFEVTWWHVAAKYP